MLNISTSNAVSWPTPQSTAVPAVSSVAPVQATQGAGRDAQAGLGAGQDRSASARRQGKEEQAPNGAPLLPRGSGEGAALLGSRSREADVAAREAAEEAAVEMAEQQANAKEEIHQRLQEVLSSVWQASAAVVDRALGREGAPGANGEVGQSGKSGSGAGVLALPPRRNMVVVQGAGFTPVETVGPVALVAQVASGTAVGPSSVAAEAGIGAGVSPPDPADLVAYDERGNGSVLPPEAGGLLSRRV
jgi:hypothetical protein